MTWETFTRLLHFSIKNLSESTQHHPFDLCRTMNKFSGFLDLLICMHACIPETAVVTNISLSGQAQNRLRSAEPILFNQLKVIETHQSQINQSHITIVRKVITFAHDAISAYLRFYKLCYYLVECDKSTFQYGHFEANNYIFRVQQFKFSCSRCYILT